MLVQIMKCSGILHRLQSLDVPFSQILILPNTKESSVPFFLPNLLLHIVILFGHQIPRNLHLDLINISTVSILSKR